MTSSQRNKLAAVIGFALIAAVVLGGMGWATVSTFQLAKLNVAEQHRRDVRLAVSEIDSHMRGILTSEAGRPYTDYLAFHAAEPAFVWAEGDEELDVEVVALPSPLRESGPLHNWIDVYFHVYEDGTWTSPQVPCGETGSRSATTCSHCPCATLGWLEKSLPVADLWERVARATERDRALATGPDEPPHSSASQITPRKGQEAKPRDPIAWRDYKRRSQRRISAQRRSFPADQCVPVRLVEKHLREQRVERLSAAAQAVFVCSPPVYVGLSPDPVVPLWLKPGKGVGLKLVFVRTGYEDGKSVQQGFIGDWKRLRLELLGMINHWFPEADIEPVPEEVSINPATSETAIASIHARLKVPDVPGGVSAAAWRNTRGFLCATWAITVAVLALAGWGIRNLVALTERRMQFAYAVTHELRTPLTTFRLYADMLSAGLVPEESRQEYVDTLNRESVRLSSLVQSVLEYARLENHKVQLNPVETDAPAMLSKIAETLQQRCSANGVEACTENQVPDGSRLRTDSDLLHQVAGVLVNNACRHTREAREPVVLVRLSSDDGKLHLDVIDSGPGVERADSRTIFKPFRRGRKAAAAAQGGIGLGLALAREWAGLLGGRLELVARHHPRYGGAHFRLTIPMRVPA